MTATTPRCVIVQPIDEMGVALLRSAGVTVDHAPSTSLSDLAPLLATADAVITRNEGFSAEAMALAPRLQVIGSHGTGVDSIDLDAARARGIAVVNTPGSNARAVGEHALALMLAAARLLLQADQEVRKGNFNWRLCRVGRGIELSGRQLGLWGYGHIARHLGQIAQGIGMRVLALSVHATDAELTAGGVRRAQDADELLAECDVLSLHGVPGPAPLLGPKQFMRMRQGAILVNTARGVLLDEAALVAALRSGHLRAAALDVFTHEPLPANSPLNDCPNLILTPHVGGITTEAMQRTAQDVAMAVLRALGIAQ